ncbi:MAG: hypothetical protein GWO24_29085 [Akkermansiaceae bacterium]|nr:hypothetical protein [Akkermansiaceae bacterium]
MVEEGVDQSTVRIAGGRMDDDAGGLVDDDEVVVLVDDVERDILGEHLGGAGVGEVDRDDIASRDRGLGAGLGSVEEDVTGLEEGLDP